MDSSHICENESSSSAVAGIKRKALFSSPERAPKRAATESVLDHLPTATSQPIHRCSVCHRPCWYCEAAIASQEDPEPSEKSMDPPKSSTTTQSEASGVSNSKRKREDGLIVGPKDPGFEIKILLPCKVEKIYGTRDDDFGPDDVFGEQSQIASSGAFLKLDEAGLKRTAQQFMEYERRGDNKNALGLICARTILIDEGILHMHPSALQAEQ